MGARLWAAGEEQNGVLTGGVRKCRRERGGIFRC